MPADKQRDGVKQQDDDVSSLFAQLGSAGGADGYQNFVPPELPSGRRSTPAEQHGEPACAHTPAQVAPPRGEHPRDIAPSAAPAAPLSGAPTPLEQMFRRLLQADVPMRPSGPLKQFFSR